MTKVSNNTRQMASVRKLNRYAPKHATPLATTFDGEDRHNCGECMLSALRRWQSTKHWSAYIHTYLIIPWNIALLRKLTGFQLVKKFPAFYGTRIYLHLLTFIFEYSYALVRYLIHECPPPFPILTQVDPVHNPTSHFLKIHFNIIFPYTPGSSKWSLSFSFPHQTLYTPFLFQIGAKVLLISFFSIWSSEQHWLRSTDH